MRSGQIAYAVLSTGGFLGIGDTLHAIPWSALTLDAIDRCFVVDIPAQRLRDEPGFDKDHWPSMADEKWGAAVHTYYNREPYWTATRDVSEGRVSDIQQSRADGRRILLHSCSAVRPSVRGGYLAAVARVTEAGDSTFDGRSPRGRGWSNIADAYHHSLFQPRDANSRFAAGRTEVEAHAGSGSWFARYQLNRDSRLGSRASGGKGLRIVVSLTAKSDYDIVKGFTRAFVRHLAKFGTFESQRLIAAKMAAPARDLTDDIDSDH